MKLRFTAFRIAVTRRVDESITSIQVLILRSALFLRQPSLGSAKQRREGTERVNEILDEMIYFDLESMSRRPENSKTKDVAANPSRWQLAGSFGSDSPRPKRRRSWSIAARGHWTESIPEAPTPFAKENQSRPCPQNTCIRIRTFQQEPSAKRALEAPLVRSEQAVQSAHH